jgi:hypothetical protein
MGDVSCLQLLRIRPFVQLQLTVLKSVAAADGLLCASRAESLVPAVQTDCPVCAVPADGMGWPNPTNSYACVGP